MALSESAKGLRELFDRLRWYKVLTWSSSSSDLDTDRQRVHKIEDADVVASMSVDGSTHILAIDIDHPAWLVKSTTPGHFHLYVDVPGGIPTGDWVALMNELANAGVIEAGYASASIQRGFSCVRLPWVKKPVPVGGVQL